MDLDEKMLHYGMPRRSGRYPWGSGKDPYQNAIGWRGHIRELKAQGFTEKEIAEGEGISIARLRDRISISKDEFRAGQRVEVLRLKDKGYSNVAIGERMGINESQVRGLLNPILAERASITKTTANVLRDDVNQKKLIDVGAGIENYMGVSRNQLNTAVSRLEDEGYKVHRVNVPQVGRPDQFTQMKVLGAPDTNWRDAVINDGANIQQTTMVSKDFGRSFNSALGLRTPTNVSSDRIKVQYGEEGRAKDGVIELRRGVKDLDMGGSRYAQVRVAVDGTHFLKGMAIYNDNLPAGVDIVFNTNKSDTGNKLDAMKKMKRDIDGNIDKDNPFGATIKEGVRGQRGALNIVNEEGDWDRWSKTISSQVLSKQTVPLAKNQLGLALHRKQQEFDEITSLTNPVVKRQLLQAFADDCDSSAAHLKAAGLPRQASKVILPVNSLKPTEVYAPSFRDGETLVLIRHPHGGTFEIAQLTVNNKNKEAISILGKDPIDAIGIHSSVAQRLSGADFDGDSVLAIPNPKGLIKTSAPLKGLQNFDPVLAYPPYDGMKTIDGGTWNAAKREIEYAEGRKPTSRKQTEMGIVSNLITDMTIKGATVDELARAVRHSMVVIDSEKHALNYKLSKEQNGISALHEKYQNSAKGGASTIISRAKSTEYISKRKPRSAAEGGPIDPHTGEKVFTVTPDLYTNKKGQVIERTVAVKKMDVTKDAFLLSSGRQIELVYAGYANELKSLANRSRKIVLETEPIPMSASAKRVYAKEVKDLQSKLDVAQRAKPLERQAHILANSVINRKKEANPHLDKEDIKKISNQALAEARTRTGKEKYNIKITDREWEAIQAGAISTSKLSQILQNADLTRIKELATPRTTVSMTPAKIGRARAMIAGGATLAEVASALGVSVSTVSKALK